MSAESNPTRSRIFIADDHPMVREWLLQMINRESDLEICGEAGSAAETLAAIPTLKPDMAIVDLTMDDSQGIELVSELTKQFEELPILVLSMHRESLYAERAIRAGAKGYITKQEATHKIKEAIRAVLSGQIYISEAHASKMIRDMATRPNKKTQLPLDSLSDRQLKVLRLIGEGYSNPQIAEMLKLSINTVESYSARIKEKLNITSANELLQYAIKFNKAVGD